MPPIASQNTAPAASKSAVLAQVTSRRQSACVHAHQKISHPAARSAFNHIRHTAGKRLQDSRRLTSCQCTPIGNAVESGWKDEDFIEVGTLGRPHGIRGEVVVSVDTSFPEERFANPGVRYIQPPPARGMFVSRPNEAPREVELLSGRPHVTKGNTVWLLRFKEIADRDAAETLRNYKMLIHKSQRAKVDGEDEFYSQDLVGLTVVLSPYHAAARPAGTRSSQATEFSDAEMQSESDDSSDAGAVPALTLTSTEKSASEGASLSAQAGNVAAAAPDAPVRDSNGSNQFQSELPEDSNSLAAEASADEAADLAFWDLGKVSDVYDGTGTHGVIRVDFSSGLMIQPNGTLQRVPGGVRGTKESGLLPFARDVVPEVDLDEGLMIIDPPVGWLEMYLTPSEKKKKKRFRKKKSPKVPAVAVVEPEEAVA